MFASNQELLGVDARCEMSMKGQSLENPKRGVEASMVGMGVDFGSTWPASNAADVRKHCRCSPPRAAAGENNAMNDASSKRT
jgi:hypothetical protein